MKKHLYTASGDYKLFTVGSDEWENALSNGYTETKAEQFKAPSDDTVSAPISELELTMIEGPLKSYTQNPIEVIGIYEDGLCLVQYKGDADLQWVIPQSVLDEEYREQEKVQGTDLTDEVFGTEKLEELPGEEDAIDLDTLSDDEIKELAKEAGIKNYANMKRETRIAKLLEL